MSIKPPRRKNKVLIISVLFLSCAVLFFVFHRFTLPAKLILKSIHPSVGTISDVLINKGTVVFERLITLRSAMSGYVTSLSYKEGDEVKANSIVAEVEDQRLNNELRSSALEIKTIVAKLNAIEIELNDLHAVYEAGGVSKQDFEQKKLEKDLTTIDLEKSNIELDRLKRTARLANITSPFYGVIMSVKVSVGQWVNAGEELLIVTGGGNKSIVANVDAMEIKQLFVGQKVYFSDQEDASNRRVGKIHGISKIIGAGQNNNLVKVTIQPLESIEDLRISQQLYIEFVVSEADNTLRVPKEYVYKNATSYYVFVLQGGIARKMRIEVDNGDSVYWQIKEGITSQDTIVKNEKGVVIEGEKYEAHDDTTIFN